MRARYTNFGGNLSSGCRENAKRSRRIIEKAGIGSQNILYYGCIRLKVLVTGRYNDIYFILVTQNILGVGFSPR